MQLTLHFRTAQLLIAINHVQNKSLCLRNICVPHVYNNYVYIKYMYIYERCLIGQERLKRIFKTQCIE